MGAAQLEVNFIHGDPLRLADEVFLFKRAVRNVAKQHDVYATFMANPMAGQPGSAMHVHQSVVDAETGRNLFRSEEHTSELQSLMRISYAVFCLKKQKNNPPLHTPPNNETKLHKHY